MAGKGGSRQLSQRMAKFSEFIKNLELEEVVVTRMDFELFSPPGKGKIAVAIDKKTEPPSLQGQKLEVFPAFTITVTQEEKEKLRFEVQYRLVFSAASQEVVAEALGNEEVLTLFQEGQIPRLVWPFLRADFHFACSKLGVPPIVLPLLR